MSLLDRLDRGLSTRSGEQIVERLFGDGLDWLKGGESGEIVSVERALGLPAMYGAISLLSNVGGTLPLIPYKRLAAGHGKERAINHDAWKLLHDQPNPETTAAEFWPQAIADYAGWGNIYIGKERYGRKLVALWGILPSRMKVKRENGRRVYVESLPGGRRKTWDQADIIHIRNITLDGVNGLSPVGALRESLGLGISMQKHAARFFRDFAIPPGVLTVKEKIDDPETKDAIRKEWKARQSKKRDIAVLDNGATFEGITVPMQDAQFVELAGLTRSDIALMYNIPPSMLASSSGDSNTYGNREADAQNFNSVALVGPLSRIQARVSVDADIFPQQRIYFAEFNRDALLAADYQTRMNGYRLALAGKPWMNVDEVRSIENLPTGVEIEGSDATLPPAVETMGAGSVRP